MRLDDLGDRLFVDVPRAAGILGRDERTVRQAAAAGEIPAARIGARWMIRSAWLREQAGVSVPVPATPAPDPAELADLVAARVLARLAALFAAAAGGEDTEATA
jgi:hypothetical protein